MQQNVCQFCKKCPKDVAEVSAGVLLNFGNAGRALFSVKNVLRRPGNNREFSTLKRIFHF
jgi:hypothetical protein